MNDITLEKLLDLGFTHFKYNYYMDLQSKRVLQSYEIARLEQAKKDPEYTLGVGGQDAYMSYFPNKDMGVNIFSSDGGDTSIVKENITSIEQIKKIIEALS